MFKAIYEIKHYSQNPSLHRWPTAQQVYEVPNWQQSTPRGQGSSLLKNNNKLLNDILK
jgi:hypothetical protein